MVDDYAIDLVRRDFNINVHNLAKLKPMAKLSENERQRIYNLRVLEGLCEHGRKGDTLAFYDEDQDIHIKLFIEYGYEDRHFMLAFPRSIKMKPFYPAILKWFDDNGIEWQDTSRIEQRYMLAEMPKDPTFLENLIESIRATIFKCEKMKSRPSSLYKEKRNYNPNIYENVYTFYFKTYLASILAFGLSFLLFLIYELVQILSLEKPALKNIDFIEIFLISIFILAPYLTNLFERKPSIKLPMKWTRKKKYTIRILAWSAILLIAASTA